MVRCRAPQVVWGIDTDCSCVCEKSPSNLLTRIQSNPGLGSTGIGLERKVRPQERGARYSTPVQINSLFSTWCFRAQMGLAPFLCRPETAVKASKLCTHITVVSERRSIMGARHDKGRQKSLSYSVSVACLK